MIRKFSLLCKLNFINNSDLSIFHSIYDSLSFSKEICSHCNARHSCSLHSTYERHLIAMQGHHIVCHTVTITRVICSSCGHTHAILPDILIPYGSYSLFFILKILRLYFLHTSTVTSLCEHFQISISTLYTWVHLFNQQKALWLGVLLHASTSSLSFLDDLLSNSCFPEHFFHAFHFSFLQFHFITTRFEYP
jgi:hypothetical protein